MRYLILILLFSGCSANWHLKKAKRHELIAISKGAIITRDTVYKEIVRDVKVPGDSGSLELNPELDMWAFSVDMVGNDSLVLAIEKLKEEQTLDKEKTLRLLVDANNKLSALRSRIVRGYSKDSTYVFKPDSLTSIGVRVERGTVKKVDYKRREAVIKAKINVPIAVNGEVKPNGVGLWQWVVLAAVVGMVIGIGVTLYLKK